MGNCFSQNDSYHNSKLQKQPVLVQSMYSRNKGHFDASGLVAGMPAPRVQSDAPYQQAQYYRNNGRFNDFHGYSGAAPPPSD